MQYLTRILLCVTLFMALSIPVQSWDCIEAHPIINQLAFEHFKARLQAGHFSDKFRNFAVDDEIEFPGLTFTKATYFENGSKAKQINARHTFSGWLKRGGHDADVPSVSMGLRHFYDPFFEPHYLTWLRRHFKWGGKGDFNSEEDFFNSLDYHADDWNPNLEFGSKERKLKLQPQILRPQIDAVTWALSHEENDYSWRSGKLAYKAAMENDTTSFGTQSRAQMFGRAFRALGETMHLMADLTQPAHARADSHPVYEPIEMTVNEKMIREIIGQNHKNPDFKPVPEFEIDPSLKPEELMKHIANFTNRNFFSNDTIFDFQKWIMPRNNKRPYPSPQLSKLKHIKGIYYAYFETVGWIPMAKETGSRFAKVHNDNDKFGRKNPHFNVMPNMAKDQARVLMPIAIYNTATLIKDFLPDFSVDFALRQSAGSVLTASGELIHNVDKDDDWREIGAILYNGPAYIQVNKNWNKCEIRDGRLIETRVSAVSGDQVRLVIRAGGVIVSSQSITIP